MEEKRHGGAGRVIVVILILAVLLAAGAFFLFGGRVHVETPSFSTGYRYDRAKDYATLDTFPVEGVTADKVELHWISGRVEIRAAETISVSENFAGDECAAPALAGWDGDTLIVAALRLRRAGAAGKDAHRHAPADSPAQGRHRLGGLRPDRRADCPTGR